MLGEPVPVDDRQPWTRAGVTHEEWVGARMKAAALERSAQRALDEIGASHPDREERTRLLRFARDVVRAVEEGDAETVALVLRHGGRSP